MPAAENTSKNSKALVATIIWHGLLLLLLLIQFNIPVPAAPPPDLGIEVNLGNSDQGLGTNQPLVQGAPAPEAKPITNPAREQSPPSAQPNIQTDDNNKEDETAINQPDKHKINTHQPAIRPTARKTTQQTIVNPKPVPARPRAVYKGGTGTGGNDQDQFNKSDNEGIAGGHGDQGNPNGNPNSKNYTGNGGTGNSGSAHILRGLEGRTFTMPSFEGDFNENQRVAVDLKVDAGGHVTSASFQQKGSSANPGSYYASKAIELAYKLKFNPSNVEEQTGTIQFNFKVRE